MKREFKLLYKSALFLATVFLLLSGKTISARAIEYDKVMEISLIDKNTCKAKNRMVVHFDTSDDHISNVRTSSKYLKAVNTSHGTEKYTNNFEYIQMYATKPGSYWMYFDIVDGSGNFKSTHKVKVFVCSKRDSYKAFKSIKVGKVNILNRLFKDDYTTKDVTLKKGGKIKVKMRKGYKLLDISVKRTVAHEQTDSGKSSTRDNTRLVEESIQNGSKLQLSEVGDNYKYYSRYHYQQLEYNDSIFGYTHLILTYKDKKGFERKNTIIIRSKLK